MKLATHRIIGPAATALSVLRVKAKRAKALKVLLHGPRGTGKTDAALRFARELAGEELNVEHVNGKEITVDFVRNYKARCTIRPLYGKAFVLVADECDRMTADAKDLLLSVLDQMPEFGAFIATTNHDLTADERMETKRFQSRLHCLEVGPPLSPEIAALLVEKMPELPARIAQTIANACDGDVRSAINDAENFLDTQTAIAA